MRHLGTKQVFTYTMLDFRENAALLAGLKADGVKTREQLDERLSEIVGRFLTERETAGATAALDAERHRLQQEIEARSKALAEAEEKLAALEQQPNGEAA